MATLFQKSIALKELYPQKEFEPVEGDLAFKSAQSLM